MIKKYVRFPKEKNQKKIKQFFLNKNLKSFVSKLNQKSMDASDMLVENHIN